MFRLLLALVACQSSHTNQLRTTAAVLLAEAIPLVVDFRIETHSFCLGCCLLLALVFTVVSQPAERARLGAPSHDNCYENRFWRQI